MLGSFYNFISKGKEVFFNSSDLFGRNFVDLLFNMIDHIYECEKSEKREVELMCATTIYIIFIENFYGKIDHLIPKIIDKSL